MHRTRMGLVALAPLLFWSCGGARSGTGASSSSLSGTWDGVGTRFGSSLTQVTVTIDSSRLVIENNAGTMTANAKGNDLEISYQQSFEVGGRFDLVRKSPPSLSLGAFPIDLSGDWQAVDLEGTPGYGCSASLGMESLSASCLEVESDEYLSVPYWLPHPAHVTVTGQRTSSSTSIFGDLGGSWQIDQQGKGSCSVEVHDKTFDASCSGSPATQGTLHVEIGPGLLSGYTSAGIEFSAQRR